MEFHVKSDEVLLGVVVRLEEFKLQALGKDLVVTLR